MRRRRGTDDTDEEDRMPKQKGSTQTIPAPEPFHHRLHREAMLMLGVSHTIAHRIALYGGNQRHLERLTNHRETKLLDQLTALLIPARIVGDLVEVPATQLPKATDQLGEDDVLSGVQEGFCTSGWKEARTDRVLSRRISPASKMVIVRNLIRLTHEELIEEMDRQGFVASDHLDAYAFAKNHGALIPTHGRIRALGSYKGEGVAQVACLTISDSDGSAQMQFRSYLSEYIPEADSYFLFSQVESEPKKASKKTSKKKLVSPKPVPSRLCVGPGFFVCFSPVFPA